MKIPQIPKLWKLAFLLFSANATAALPVIQTSTPATELIKAGVLKNCATVYGCIDSENYVNSVASQEITKPKDYILRLAATWQDTLTYRFNSASGTRSIFNGAVQGARRLKENLKIWSNLNAVKKNSRALEKITFLKSDKNNAKLFTILTDIGVIPSTASSVNISYAELYDHLHTKAIPANYFTGDTQKWSYEKPNFPKLYTRVIERRCAGIDNTNNWFMGNNRDLEESHACGVAGIMFPTAAGSASRVIALGLDVKNALGLYDTTKEIARVPGFDMRNPESPRYQNETFSLAVSGYNALARMATADVLPRIDGSNSLALLGTVRSLIFMRSGPVKFNQSKAVSTYVQSHGDSTHLSLLDDLVEIFGLLPYSYKNSHIHALARVWLSEGRKLSELQNRINSTLSSNQVLKVPGAESINYSASNELDSSWVNDAGLGVMRRGRFESPDGMTLMYKGTGAELTHWHEDQGTFELYAFGTPIALNTDAYGYDAIYRQLDINDLLKGSRHKNGVSFEDSKGFHMYGLQGTSGRQAHVRVAKSSTAIDYAFIDTTAAYFASQSANRFGRIDAFLQNKTSVTRAIALNKETGYVVVIDSIKNLPRATDANMSQDRLIHTVSSNFQIPGNQQVAPQSNQNASARFIQLTNVGDACVGVQILNPHADGSVKLERKFATDTQKTGETKSEDPNWGLNFVPSDWQRAHIAQKATVASVEPSENISTRIVTVLYPNKLSNCTQPVKQLSSAQIIGNDASGLQIKINFDGKFDAFSFNENSGLIFTSANNGRQTALAHSFDKPRADLKIEFESSGTTLITNTSNKTISDPIFVLGALSLESLKNNIVVDPDGPNFPSYTVGALVTASPLRAGAKLRVKLQQYNSSVVAATGRNF